jgi:hypothetical protein
MRLPSTQAPEPVLDPAPLLQLGQDEPNEAVA